MRTQAGGAGPPVMKSRDVRLLGDISVSIDGEQLALGGPKQRLVLALLAIDVGRPVELDRLAEGVWGATAPPRAEASLHSYLSKLRGILASADDDDVIRRVGTGYVLDISPE